MAFQIPKQTKARVASETIIGENHGSKKIQPAISLRLTCALSNDWLDNLHPQVRQAFYKAGSLEQAIAKDGQKELEVSTHMSDTPVPRFQFLAGFPWEQQFTGLTLTVDIGTGRPKSNIVMEDAIADNLQVSLKPNSIELAFNIRSNKPDDATRGRLTGLIKTDVWIEVKAPEVLQSDIEDDEQEQAEQEQEEQPASTNPATPLDAMRQAFGEAPASGFPEPDRPEGWPFPKDAKQLGADAPPETDPRVSTKRRRVINTPPTH